MRVDSQRAVHMSVKHSLDRATSRQADKQPRVGFFKGYDKQQHAVKVQLLPRGTILG